MGFQPVMGAGSLEFILVDGFVDKVNKPLRVGLPFTFAYARFLANRSQRVWRPRHPGSKLIGPIVG